MSVLSEKHKKVLKYLVDTFDNAGILFQATSGLAANVYGSSRSLYDIDIDVYKKDIPKAQELFRKHVVSDFVHEQNESFDLYEFTLKIDGVTVDVSQAEESYAIGKDGTKILVMNDIKNASKHTFEGIAFRVLDKGQLVRYKTHVARSTDLSDVKEITALASKVHIYIDGNNLYRGAKELGFTIDYKKFRGWLRQKYNPTSVYLYHRSCS
ncbi:MAG: hypothetical protein AAB391_03555 [Patescibacteria group bacterium]